MFFWALLPGSSYVFLHALSHVLFLEALAPPVCTQLAVLPFLINILLTWPLSDLWFTNIMSHSVGFLFTFLTMPFDEQFFNFDKAKFIHFFSLVAYALGVMYKNYNNTLHSFPPPAYLFPAYRAASGGRCPCTHRMLSGLLRLLRGAWKKETWASPRDGCQKNHTEHMQEAWQAPLMAQAPRGSDECEAGGPGAVNEGTASAPWKMPASCILPIMWLSC